MNERIKQLAEQAGIYKLNLSDETEYWIMEKFAQLIIGECMGHVTWVGKTNQWPIETFLTVRAINKRIKEQLGVEE